MLWYWRYQQALHYIKKSGDFIQHTHKLVQRRFTYVIGMMLSSILFPNHYELAFTICAIVTWRCIYAFFNFACCTRGKLPILCIRRFPIKFIKATCFEISFSTCNIWIFFSNILLLANLSYIQWSYWQQISPSVRLTIQDAVNYEATVWWEVSSSSLRRKANHQVIFCFVGILAQK